ncbi:MAG: tRNA guanosine(34) transglycosylase Tgt [Oscillospiraceae bacterium]|nr:tRNA guanosine(34) transglycosylase Tgt [Oscillospiraceae bacterium]
MFKLLKTQNKARRGTFTTPHGEVQTPVFMNVATQGAIKGALSAEDLTTVGCQVALANTYHLHVRPGDDLVQRLGGLHRMMTWDGPMLTDSGGFQIFSLAGLRKITEEGVTFQSHVDGRRIFISPEKSMQIQANLGSDIAMAFDECIEIPAPRDYVARSCERTLRWLERCKAELDRLGETGELVTPGQVLFGINQGATYPDLRIRHMQQIAELNLPGYAIGGLAVGESHAEMYETIETVEPHMPQDRPRYLMGVGTPSNLIEAVARGIDFFDCVMPARNGRHGHLFTWEGVININNEKHRESQGPIDPACGCSTCKRYSRAYLRHLFKCGELLAMRLAVTHNLYFYNSLMREMQKAIEEDCFDTFRRAFSEKLAQKL